MPPRTVANSDKEKIRLKQTTKAESTNPALTQTANPRTWQPGINSDRQPQSPQKPKREHKPTERERKAPPNLKRQR